ncbi:MAG TPA: response regulator transcription factor [Vicinamibacteria bacterium]|nr:response regulator transcription factor [Vicinamibacteria bacterium]
MVDLLLVDPNAQRRLDVWDRLVEEGYRVEVAALGREALERVLSGGIDLVLLDVALGDRDGLSVCQELRQRGFSGALILVTDPERARERVRGLQLGADDVLTRPFELIELSARIEACLRRGTAFPAPAAALLRFGDVEVDLRRACVSKAGRPVHVSPREFHLLRCLVERAGTPVSRAELLDHAWGRDAMPGPQTVDVHIAWLRHKLEQDPRRPALIRTVHGIGYVLSDPDAG